MKNNIKFTPPPHFTLFCIHVDFPFRGYVNDAGCGFPLHSEIVMPYISNYGTPEQIQKFIPPMTEGKLIGAIAMTEPAAGR